MSSGEAAMGQSRRGRKTAPARREHFLETYGARVVEVVENESGRKCEDFSVVEFKQAITELESERGHVGRW